MSVTNLIPLDFAMSFDDLVENCVEKEAYLNRDATDLAARGVTPAMITAFESERVAFVAIPSNATERSVSSLGFSNRNTQIGVLRKAVTVVMDIARDTFKINSAEYKSFNVKGLSKLNGFDLMNICPNIISRATFYSTQMTVKGLTPTMLTNISSGVTTLLPLSSATPTLVGIAESTTIIRHNAANSLYSTMKGLCSTGHAFYMAADNKLKAENYVIYDKASKVVDRTGTVKPKKIETRKTDDIEATTRIRLKVETGISLQFYYGMTTKSLPPTTATTVEFNPNVFVKTTAEALGYSVAGGIIHFLVYNPNADDADFLAKIG